MSQPFRLSQGGRIDRDRSLAFTFNGRRLEGHPGDTLASALLANGVRLVGRSWKLHRPRGIYSAGAEEPAAIVDVGGGATRLANRRATEVELTAGLEARSVNCSPSLAFDWRAAQGWFSRLLPPGFYYKTFMWPQRLWPRYEQLLRNAAGLGRAPDGPDPDRYEHRHAHCDLLIVGMGAAGLAAALAAGRRGARVVIADEQLEPGGALLASSASIDGQPAATWLAAALAELAAMGEVTLLPRTTVFGLYDHGMAGLVEQCRGPLARERVWHLRARRTVLATGAIERPLVLPNNDRPGVMSLSATAIYARRYAVAAGRRAVVFTNHSGAYADAVALADAGIEVAAVVDAREGVATHPALAERGIAQLVGQLVLNVRGGRQVRGVRIGQADGETRRIDCDLLALSGGWNPALHLYAHAGGRPRFDDARACFVPDTALPGIAIAGGANGNGSLHAALDEGHRAGAEAARACGLDGDPGPAPRGDPDEEPAIAPLWAVPGPPGAKAFVDLQNDVTAADIALAVNEGFRSVEHLKRYTALGMGTDQGKLGNLNGHALLAGARGDSIAVTGTSTFRPPYTPVTFGALAGRHIGELADPLRKTALHAWHARQGAVFENVGQWQRPRYYPRHGETMAQAVVRECLAVRRGVGLIDASTLGKIDVRGPDATEFLNRMFINRWDSLAVGRCRYGMLLREDGMVFDDGVNARLADDRFFLTTTTGNAAAVMSWFERWLQTEWPQLRVHLTSQTDHWSVAAVAGPRSRAVIAAAGTDIDLSPEALPFMALATGTLAGVPVRLLRISFSGELAFEVHAPANHARRVWEALMEAGAPYDITPYGTEAMHVLRAEKGFVIIGQETDGSVTPDDLGYGRMVAKIKDCIGKRSLTRPDCVRTNRRQLVGLRTEEGNVVLPEGAQLVDDPAGTAPVPMIGHVTSSYHSPILDRSIALALVDGGRSRLGERVHAPLADGRVVTATICEPLFYDPQGKRQHD